MDYAMSGDAITVSNEATIDHWELGRGFANWDNQQQSLFLHGFSIGLQDLGSYCGLQLLAIRDAAKQDGTAVEQQELIRLLHEYLVEPLEGAA